MGMKYCKRKIPRSRKTLLKVVISFPVFERIRKKLDNELWSVERSSCTAKNLGQISKPGVIKNFYQYSLQELIIHYSSNLDVFSERQLSRVHLFS